MRFIRTYPATIITVLAVVIDASQGFTIFQTIWFDPVRALLSRASLVFAGVLWIFLIVIPEIRGTLRLGE